MSLGQSRRGARSAGRRRGGGTPTFSQLVEDWSTGIDAAKWEVGGGPTVSGGMLSIPANTSYADYVKTWAEYDLANSSIYAEVVPSTGPGTREIYMVLSSAAGDELTIGHNGTMLYCDYRVGSGGARTTLGTATYSPTTHRWWRTRHNGTQVIFDTSPDRVTWTQLGAWTPTIAVGQLKVMFGAGQYGGDGTSTAQAMIDNINFATFSPTSITGLGLWYDASTLAQAEGTLLDTLPDLSGNGRHATQTGTVRPTVRAASVNGKTSVEFLGTQSLVTASYIPQTGAGARTVFVVLRDVALGTNVALNHVYHYGTNTALAAYGMNTRIASVMRFGAHYWNGTMTNGPTNVSGVTYVMHQKYDGTTDQLFDKMTEVGSSARALVTGSTTPFRLGTSVANGEFGRFRLCEIAVWPRELTATERQQMVDYLSAKWGA